MPLLKTMQNVCIYLYAQLHTWEVNGCSSANLHFGGKFKEHKSLYDLCPRPLQIILQLFKYYVKAMLNTLKCKCLSHYNYSVSLTIIFYLCK